MSRVPTAILFLAAQTTLSSHALASPTEGAYRRHEYSPSGSWSPEADSNVHDSNKRSAPIFGDINGDGTDDACWGFGAPIRTYGVVCSETETTWYANVSLDLDEHGEPVPDWRWVQGIGELYPESDWWVPYTLRLERRGDDALESFVDSMALVDVNRDRLADLCGRAADGIRCALSNGSGFEDATLWIDDFSDRKGWASHDAYASTIQFVDIDGDGRTDVCGRGAAGVWCARSDGRSFGESRDMALANVFSNANGWAGSHAYYSTIMFADLEGDGDLDVCGRGSAGITCQRYDSWYQDFSAPELVTSLFSNSYGWTRPEYYSTIQFANIDGDRFADICGRGAAGIYCLNGTGSTSGGTASFTGGSTVLAPEFSNANGWNQERYYSSLMLTDVNGDGMDDVCGRGIDGFNCALRTTLWEILFMGKTTTFSAAQVWTADFGDIHGNVTQFDSFSAANTTSHYGTEICGMTTSGVRCSNR